ncbi:MAG: 4Fe-4S dicluster domain-containing protein [Eubacteriales bacterium]
MDLIEKIYKAGVVGCGGAGFPTHIKLNCKVEYLIINGAECEPLLRTDRYIMKNKAIEIIKAVEAVGKVVEAQQCIIVLKKTYHEEIKSLETAIKELNSQVQLHQLDNFYPAGDEQIIVCEVTGRTVPPAGIPLDVGSVVSNTATMLCIYEAIQDKSFTHKYLTVTGEVKTPVVLYVPVGITFEECLNKAGGALGEDYKIISGGPLMGSIINKNQAKTTYVTKTTSGIIVIPEDNHLALQSEVSVQHMLNRAKSACIQCSYCTELCPRNLIGHPLKPHKIMRKLAYNNISEMLDDEDVKQALICCECGVCEIFACPMGLMPRKVNAFIKQEYAKSGIRYDKEQGEYLARDTREYRKIPSKRMAARSGLLKYYDYKIDTLVRLETNRVEIQLKQHIGAPAQPIVGVGDIVEEGQLIAGCERDKMGANLHASISGKVIMVSDKIVIERQ